MLLDGWKASQHDVDVVANKAVMKKADWIDDFMVLMVLVNVVS
jgi:hypothetical protein